MKTAVIGSRTFDNYQQLKAVLDNLSEKPTEIISGGAKGADALAERYAKENSLPLKVIPANWERHGKAAGPIRNLLIIEASEQIIAMWDGQSKGTEHTIKTARQLNRPTKVVHYLQTQQTSLW